MGEIDMQIPTLRKASYIPARLLDARQRSGGALLAASGEAYVLCISTPRVHLPLETLRLSGTSMSRVSEIVADLDSTIETLRRRPLTLSYPFV